MRIRHRVLTLAAAVSLSAAVPAVAQDTTAAPPPAATPAAPSVNESWTARILYPVAARKTPGGKVYRRLVHYTPWSQAPAVYMVTESTMVGDKQWVRVQLPYRPNGRQAWVPAEAVDLKRTTTWIRVSVSTRTVTVFSDGKRVKRFKAAVGTGGTPTPKGLFAIYDPVRTNGQLGPYILVLTAHSNVLRTFMGGDGIVGIHGWPTSSVLGRAVSNGCVRMSRTGVRALARYAKSGVPVEIIA
jgi:lipoprotein-anchoring transpeptidase ErfK/SrfK